MSRHPDPNSRCTPLADWPQADLDAWMLAQESADPLDPSLGYATRWKASTRKVIENGYGRWLGWLQRSGLLDPAAPAGTRATPERLKAYLEALRASGLADYSVAGRLQQLCNALRAIAPAGDWSWIHRASSRIHSHAVPRRDIVGRMQPAEAIITLGHDLMEAAEHDRFRTDCERATLFRDGLILAFLAQRALRAANLASITLGRQLENRGGQWRLFFDGAETKGGEAIDCAWPEDLVAPLERYLDVHRKQLLKCAVAPRRVTQTLWISKRGGAMGTDAMSFQINARTKETFGRPINPHTFRHIAATTIAEANPQGARDIQSVLGHSSMGASEKHYNRARTLGAGASLHATIAGLRKRPRPGSDGRPPNSA